VKHLIRVFVTSVWFLISARHHHPLFAQVSSVGPEASTRVAHLRGLIEAFSADSFLGREAGQVGNRRAVDFLIQTAKASGMLPAGENNTYSQLVPLRLRSTNPTSSMSAGEMQLTYGSDWVGAAPSSFARHGLQIVFGGTLGDSVSLISPEAVRGKFVVLNSQPGGAGRFPIAMQRQAAAVARVVSSEQLASFQRPRVVLDDPRDSANGPLAEFYISDAAADKLFAHPIDQLEPGSTGKTVDIDLRITLQDLPAETFNVVAAIRGRDPVLSHEYIVVSAHLDHIGVARPAVAHDSARAWGQVVRPAGANTPMAGVSGQQQSQINRMISEARRTSSVGARADSVFNGADDDASGSVALFDIARQLSEATPLKRSVLFIWHNAEEKGLLGSRHFVQHATVPLDSIVALINLDMIGRGRPEDLVGQSSNGRPLHGGPNYVQVIGSRRNSRQFGDVIESVNRMKQHQLELDYELDVRGHPSNMFCRGDQAEYGRKGIPAALFTTGSHSDYHQRTDESQYLDFDKLARISSLVADIVERMASAEHRVVVSHDGGDGACR